MKNPLRGAVARFADWAIAKSYGTPFRWPVTFGGRNIAASPLLTREAIGSATVARCILVISSTIASCPLVIERRTGKGKWERLEDDDDTSFNGVGRLFRRPNKDQGAAEFWTLHQAGKQVWGRNYILDDYVNGGRVPRGREYPRELRVLRGDDVEPILSPDPRVYSPLGYRYRPTAEEFRPDEIMPDRMPSAVSPLEGVSPLVSSYVYALLEDTLGWYHHGFFKNGARAGTVFETPEKLTKKQLQELRESWNEQHGNAAGKAFSTVFLHSGMTLKELEAGAKKVDFPELFRQPKEQIGMAFGVPPVKLGDFSNAALANIKDQTPIFLEDTCMTITRVTQDQLNNTQVDRFGGGFRFRYAWEDTPAMKRIALDRVAAWVQATGGVAFLKPNEVREREGLEPAEGGESLYVSFSMMPAGSPRPEPASRPPAAGQDDDQGEDDGKASKGRRPKAPQKWIDDPGRHAKRARASLSMARFEPAARTELETLIDGQVARMHEQLATHGKAFGQKAAVDPEEIFDEEFEAEVTRDVLVRIYARIVGLRGPEAFAEIGAPGEFKMDHRDVVAWLKEHAYERGTLITDTTAEMVARAVEASTAAGESIQELTDRIAALGQVRRHEAQRIARTETAAGYNFATNEAFVQSGIVEETEWLTAQDDAVRDAHRDMDGKTAKLGEPFILTDDKGATYEALFPGDPNLPPSLSINCRCVAMPKVRRPDEPEERGYKAAPDLAALFAGKALTVPAGLL